MNRRHFLFASDTKKHATDRKKLGPRGVEVSRLVTGACIHGVGGRSKQRPASARLHLYSAATLYAQRRLAPAQERRHVRILQHGRFCHTVGALKAAARNPWVEVDLARVNPAQKHMDADPAAASVLKQMKASGKGVRG